MADHLFFDPQRAALEAQQLQLKMLRQQAHDLDQAVAHNEHMRQLQRRTAEKDYRAAIHRAAETRHRADIAATEAALQRHRPDVQALDDIDQAESESVYEETAAALDRMATPDMTAPFSRRQTDLPDPTDPEMVTPY